MNEAWYHIIKSYVTDFTYNENSYTMVIYYRYFHDSILFLKKNQKEPILGALLILIFFI